MSNLSVWRSRLAALPEQLMFSKFPIDSRTVFHASETSFAFTNLKPVVPGHVLISPVRVVERLTQLTPVELADLFEGARVVGDAILLAHPHADSLTLTVQDGRSAGQTVAHVHVHIMPRWPTDPFNSSRGGNDEVYSAIDNAEKVMMDEPDSVPPRQKADMISEAESLRTIVESLLMK